MIHWKEGREKNGTDRGIIISGRDDDSVFMIYPKNGLFVFQEECDGYYKTAKTKEKAIEALQEAIEWIKKCE